MNAESICARPPAKRLGYLIALRPLLLLMFQVILFGLPWVGSQAQARMYWPIPVILANAVCFCLMVFLARGRCLKIKNIYLAPFEDDLGLTWINRWRPAQKIPEWVKYLLAFILLFAVLGFPALYAMARMDSLARIMIPPDASFPDWVRLLIVFALPLSQTAAEIPWYNGFFLPLIERSARASGAARACSAVFACAAAAFVFSLQHGFIPFAPLSGLWIRCVMWLPVTLVISLSVRLFPRLMPLLLLSHGLMALTAGLSFL